MTQFHGCASRYAIVGGEWQIKSFVTAEIVPITINHDSTIPAVGEAFDFQHTDGGLYFDAKFFDTPEAQEVATKVREGVLGGLSLHTEGHYKKQDDGTRVYNEAKLLDISVVRSPADPDAWIGLLKTRSELLQEMRADLRAIRQLRS